MKRIVLAVAVVGVVTGYLLKATPRTPTFRGADGRVLENSIAEMQMVRLGGFDQWVLIRGENTEHPILLVLHGGPGTSEAALFRRFQSGLERYFVVVHWDQRGTGKSYRSNLPPSILTTEQFVSDLDELISYLTKRFHKSGVILLGHSWGTLLGTIYTAQHPQKVLAYFGVGQISNMLASDHAGYDFALQQAHQRQNASALSELDRIGPPPYDVETMRVQRKWVTTFDGNFHANLSKAKLIISAFFAEESTWSDLFAFLKGQKLLVTRLWPEIAKVDLTRDFIHFDTPIFFLLGRHDFMISSSQAEAYFQRINAPHKHLVYFEHSAHSPMFEEPEAFASALINLWTEWADKSR